MRQGITNEQANKALSDLVNKFADTCETGVSSIDDLIDIPTLPPAKDIPEIGAQIVIFTNLGAAVLIIGYIVYLFMTRSNGFSAKKSGGLSPRR